MKRQPRAVDLKNATAAIRWQITHIGPETFEGKPKSAAGEATISLDSTTVTVLRAHKARQNAERPVPPSEQRAGIQWHWRLRLCGVDPLRCADWAERCLGVVIGVQQYFADDHSPPEFLD